MNIQMNLRAEIQERLWVAIQETYQVGNYKGSILDSINLLGDLIREKSGLGGDGGPLIGQAFGGTSPIIKVNALQTESERDEQKGIEQLLRGLFTAIRNPRSHGMKTDTKEIADSIICFIDLMVSWIDKSRSPFDTNQLIEQVFDPHFVPNETYANLLAREIPPGKRLDLLVQVFQRREEGDIVHICLFCEEVLLLLKPEEAAQYWSVVSEEIQTKQDVREISSAIKLAASHWGACSELGRARAENLMIQSIKKGLYVPGVPLNPSASLGIWAHNITEHFVLRSQLTATLIRKIGSDSVPEREYVWSYFLYDLIALVPTPSPFLKTTICDLLKAEDRDTFVALQIVQKDSCEQGWIEAFREAHTACPLNITDDDIPF
jgi:uncharacterized protein (TIGR02391 family)